MNPAKVERTKVRSLTDLPNIGLAMARDLEFIGILKPEHLKGKDPVALYKALCRKSGIRHDPCVLDVFISVTRFMGGEEPRLWWAYTEERKGITQLKSTHSTPRAKARGMLRVDTERGFLPRFKNRGLAPSNVSKVGRSGSRKSGG